MVPPKSIFWKAQARALVFWYQQLFRRQIFWHNSNGLGSRVARNSPRGWGGFFEIWFNRKRSWPEFWCVFSWDEANSHRFSVQKQVIPPQKKVFTKIQSYFSSNIKWFASHLTIFGGLFSNGGAISRFRAKINLKAAKNMLFCILFRPMGGYSNIYPPWLRY